MAIKTTLKNQGDDASKRVEQLEIEVSILRDAYFQLEKAITERKKAEGALRESEKRHRKLFEDANDMIQSIGPEGALVDVNPMWCQVMGYTKEEALKMNLMDIIHPRSKQHCMELFKKVISGESVENIEAEFITKEGKVVIVNGNASCIFDNGKPSVTWGLFRDVTDSRKAEGALRKSEEKHRVLTETSPDCIKLFDLKGNLLFINQGGLKEHGLKSLEEALSSKWKALDTLVEEDKLKFKKAFEEVVKGKIATIEMRHTPEGSNREVCLETLAPIKDDKGKIVGIFGVSRDITERKKAEYDLRERMKELRVIYETSRIMEGSTDLNKALSEVAKVIAPAYQFPELVCVRIIYDEKEYKTENFKETKWKQSVIIQKAGKRAGAVEVYYLEERPFVVEEEKMIKEVAAQIGNITERKSTREELSKSEEKYRTLTSNIPGMVYRAKPDWSTEIVSNSEAICGYSVEEFGSGKVNWGNLIHPDDKERVFKESQPMTKKPLGLEQEYRIIAKDGQTRWVGDNKVSLFKEGVFLGVDGIVFNITERKRVEGALEASKKSLIEAQRVARLGSWELDLVSNKLKWSDEIYNIFGLKPQEFEATYEAFLKMVHPDDRGLTDRVYASSVKDKRPYDLIHRIKKPNGEVRFVHEKCEHIVDEKGKIVRSLGTIQDITEQKKAEAALQAAEVAKVKAKQAEAVSGRLRELDKMKSEFLDVASHELRTPLTAIRGNIALIQQYFSEKLEDEELKNMLADVHEGSVRLIRVVNDFLDVSRLEGKKIEFKKEKFEVAKLVQGILDELETTASQKGIYLRLEQTQGYLPKVVADQEKTRQVITNLVGNAIKFTEKGGVSLRLEREDGLVKIKVSDTGIGISEEKQKLLFQKFQQAGEKVLTRDVTRGTGLGLYISKMLAEEMGGKVYLEKSELGKGSTFGFSLPRAEAGGGVAS